VLRGDGGRQFLEQASPLTCETNELDEARVGLTGVQGEREFAEEGLPGPARGEMNSDAARSLTNASADFEEPGAQRFDLYRPPRFRQLQ